MTTDAPLTETQKRMVYFEVPGSHARTSKDTGSRANIKYLNLVMVLVEGPLHRIYGNGMNEKVGIITSYSRQKELYEVKLQGLREKGWSDATLPQVLTVNEASGREFDQTMLDEVDCMTADNDMGLLRKDPHANTFFTLARKAMWIVGGKPSAKKVWAREDTTERKTDLDEDGMSKFINVCYHETLTRADCIFAEDGQKVGEQEWPADLQY